MDKFPTDVMLAEKLTDGDPNILSSPIFKPIEKPNYKYIFGEEKSLPGKTPVRKRGKSINEPSGDIWSDKRERKNSLTSPSHNLKAHNVSSSPRQITHPRFTNTSSENQHEVRIRQQPTFHSRPDIIETPNYKCHTCSFTTNRLNVIVLHNKFHQQQSPQEQIKNIKTPASVKGRSKTSSSLSINKTINKKTSQPSTSTNTSTPRVSSSVENSKKKLKFNKSDKIQTPSKRKPSKIVEETKKKKLNEEFTKQLLEDWDEDDDEDEINKDSNKSISDINISQENEESNKASEIIKDNSQEEKDCFDFDEKIDSVLNNVLEERAKKFAETRKIPKVTEKSEIFEDKEKNEINKEANFQQDIKNKENEEINISSDFNIKSAPNEIKEKQVKELKDDIPDKSPPDLSKLDDDFKHLMEETTVPDVPSLDISQKNHLKEESLNETSHIFENSSKEIEIEKKNIESAQKKDDETLVDLDNENNVDVKDTTEMGSNLKYNETLLTSKFKQSNNSDNNELDINSLQFVMTEQTNIKDLPPSTSGELHTVIFNKESYSSPKKKETNEDDKVVNSSIPTSPILNKKTIRRIVTSLKNQTSLLTPEVSTPSTSNQFTIIKNRNQIENNDGESKTNSKKLMGKSTHIEPNEKIEGNNIELTLIINQKTDVNRTKKLTNENTKTLSPKSEKIQPKISSSNTKTQMSPIITNSHARQLNRIQKDKNTNKIKQNIGPSFNSLNKIIPKTSCPNRIVKYTVPTTSQQESSVSVSHPQRPRILGSKCRVIPSKSKTNFSKHTNTLESGIDKKKVEGTPSSSSKETSTLTTSPNSNQDSKIASNIESIVSSPIQQVIAQAQEQAVDGTTTYVLLTIDGSLSGYDGAPLVIENSQNESDIENLFLINSTTSSNDDITGHNQNNLPTTKTNQDILAAALANTDVFQTDTSLSATNTMKNEVIIDNSVLAPSSSIVAQLTQQITNIPGSLPTRNRAAVSETSLTLNKPIMSPLEVGTASMSNLQVAPPLRDPLELPLTITEPAFSSLSGSNITPDFQSSLPIMSDTETNQDSSSVLETIETEVIEQFSQEESFNYSEFSENSEVNSQQDIIKT